MIDFTHATGSKNHKSSFESAANEIISRVTNLLNEYEETHSKLEEYRKERASIIENMIDFFKGNKIRLEKPLSNCSNSELKEVVNHALYNSNFSNDIKAEIREQLSKVNELYHKIKPLGEKLESLSIKLSDYRVEEKDADNEVVVDLRKYKKNKDKINNKDIVVKGTIRQESINITNGLDEVIKVHAANHELVSSLNSDLDSKKIDPLEIDEYDKITPSFTSKEKMKAFMERMDKEFEIQEEEKEKIPFVIDERLTLEDIAENVYGDRNLWMDLYEFDNNSKKIDSIVQELGITLGEAISTPGILKGLELNFPIEIKKKNYFSKRYAA